MARLIQPTPTLRGSDAKRLVRELVSVVCSPEERARRTVAARRRRAEMMRPKVSLAQRVASRYVLALDIKEKLRAFKQSRRRIERALGEGDVASAKKLFIELGRDLEPLARSLEGVVIQRKEEQQKLKNVKQWLHRLTYPFEPKNMVEDEDERGIWIRLSLDTVGEALASLARVQSRLEGYQKVEKEFRHGPFRVVNKYGYSPEEYRTPLELLDTVSAELKKAGYGNLLYGDVTLTGSRGIGGRYAGKYDAASDSILLNVEAANRFDSVYTLVHEFGHRSWYKSLSAAQRDAYEEAYGGTVGLTLEAREDMFQALVKAGFRPRTAKRHLKDPNLPLEEYFKDTYSGTQTTSKALAEAHARGEQWVYRNFVRPGTRFMFLEGLSPVTVTEYAKTNVKEDYAETFAHRVLRKPMPSEVSERFPG